MMVQNLLQPNHMFMFGVGLLSLLGACGFLYIVMNELVKMIRRYLDIGRWDTLIVVSFIVTLLGIIAHLIFWIKFI